MIIDFSLQNFRSIRDEQTISMTATSLKEHSGNFVGLENEKNISVLKSALLYGANASGKSNILQGIETLKLLVYESGDYKLNQGIPHYQPFKLDEKWKTAPTKFEIEFLNTDQIRYKYSIEYNQKTFLKEELFFYPNKIEALLYSIKSDGNIKFGEYLKGKKQSLASELLENQLFLSRAANSNHKQLGAVYSYIADHMLTIVRGASNLEVPYSFTTDMLLLDGKSDLKERIGEFLKSADTGIRSIEPVKTEIDIEFPKDMPEKLKIAIEKQSTLSVKFKHAVYSDNKEVGEISLRIDEESDGTRKLYELSGHIFLAMDIGGTMIIDELDTSMHPLMSEAIIKLVHEHKGGEPEAQLITTTHNTALLNPELLRRDQIWFVEKDKYGATKVFSLAEFDKTEVRKNTPFEKWYLDGKFGGLPVIRKTFFSRDSGGNSNAS